MMCAGMALQSKSKWFFEVGEQLAFLEDVGAAGSDEVGPEAESGLPGGGLIGEDEGTQLLAQDFGVEERGWPRIARGQLACIRHTGGEQLSGT
jgi:hypothetical protein